MQEINMLTRILYSALLYVDADARMESFTDKDGNQRTGLNLIQSKHFINLKFHQPQNTYNYCLCFLESP